MPKTVQMNKKRCNLTLRFELELLERLKDTAKNLDMQVTRIVENAIISELDKLNKKE